jgi:pSer/pThr/pTyr-binding forkhead associated (FHA) protein
MICVFNVIGGPSRGTRVWVQTNETLEIGRRSNAGFSIHADTYLSRHHCIVEGLKSAFRVRDVGSVNGTFVNNAKVNSIELCDGDRIRVGNTLLEVRMLENENPHSSDGIHFGVYPQEPVEINDSETTAYRYKNLALIAAPERLSTIEI